MKYFIFITAIVFFNTTINAQQKQRRIIFDMAGSDTADHNAIIRQVNNVLKNAPDAKIEVVFHGRAVYALITNKTTIKEKIDDLVKNKNIVFAACNNSLNQLNLSKDDVISSAIVVPVAVLELTDKQEHGWSYIKAGH